MTVQKVIYIKFDLKELPEIDDFYNSRGQIRSSEEVLSRLYGCGITVFRADDILFVFKLCYMSLRLVEV
jgi:hypothetical protein